MERKKEEYSSALRSRSMITTALIQLMKIKPFEDITINDITNMANLSRRTFYAHYKSKIEVLESYIRETSYTYIDSNFENIRRGIISLPEFYFSLWYKHMDFLLLLHRNNLLLLIRPEEEFVTFTEGKFDLCTEIKCSQLSQKYANTFYTGALWNILVKWIEMGMKESVKDLGEIFSELIGWG